VPPPRSLAAAARSFTLASPPEACANDAKGKQNNCKATTAAVIRTKRIFLIVALYGKRFCKVIARPAHCRGDGQLRAKSVQVRATWAMPVKK
jgi:hypothetical protein